MENEENELIARMRIRRHGVITLNRFALEHLGVEMDDYVTIRKGSDNKIILTGATLVER